MAQGNVVELRYLTEKRRGENLDSDVALRENEPSAILVSEATSCQAFFFN